MVSFLDYLRGLPEYRGQMVHVEHIPPREARYASLKTPFSPVLQESLGRMGIAALYAHQARAIDAAREGKNVMVVTPTASGKTLCYNGAVMDCLSNDRHSRALYLFPTKALAQDQLRTLHGLAAAGLSFFAATFDGDTPSEQRSRIKKAAHIVLTNPDMLHLGILPNHASWGAFLRRLRYVVVDEAHVYRGVFGSQVANVLRRLRRLCRHYSASPQFICCSATIANPGDHAERLIGLPVEVVNEDGSPRGAKDFVLWDPPYIDAARGTRRSANSEAAFLFTRMVRHGIRNITFAKTRRVAELLYLYAREELARDQPDLAQRIRPYRAGYLAEDRRQIERGLFEGELLGVTATTALELGVDIGDLEGTVLTGYPGSIASTWQQAGRSGRGRDPSLSILIGLDNPLDQYLMRHPEAFFGQSHEHALIDPGNIHVLQQHLLCAAYELPLIEEDETFFGPTFGKGIAALGEQGLLNLRTQRWFASATIPYPAERVNIRSISQDNYILVDACQGGRLLETVEGAVAFMQIHPGAVYLHQGEAYLITRLDLPGRTAYAVPTDGGYYTQSKDLTSVHVLEESRHKVSGGTGVHLGRVQVTTTVVGFKKKKQFTEEVLGEEPLDLPPQTFDTVALWFDVPQHITLRLQKDRLDFAGGLHAVEHAAIGIMPLFAMCDRQDMGGLSSPWHADTGKAGVFIYDAHPGGIGIAEKGYELVEELWRRTLEAIAECPCEAGCPGCIQSPKCGNNNEPLDKGAARVILGMLLGG